MKKVLFATIVALGFTTASAQCTTCPAPAPQKIDPMAFNPGVFTPCPAGGVCRGTAYIKEEPTMTADWPLPMVAYVQMVNPATNQLVEVPISGLMFKIPSDWEGAYRINKTTGAPVTYPKPVPFTISSKFAVSTDGRQLIDAKGQPIPVTSISF